MHQIIVTPSHNRSRKWDERPGQPGIHIVLYCIVLYINKAGVRKLLQNIKPHKAAGPDNILGRILCEATNNLATAMTILFQASIDQGTLLDDWKTANVAPIFNKGDRYKAANYRPVSLTCISCKLMEHMISSSMMRHLDDNGILTDTQHGFRRHQLCESQLISTVHDLAKGIEDRKQTDVVLYIRL